MFSVVILTLNEERDLPLCLASVRDCADIVILDSGSTDRTLEIAREAGARVYTNPFQNFGDQRNFAQTQIAFRHPWVFHLDADEQMTPELLAECREAARNNDTLVDGYWVAPKMIFFDRWIPHCTDYPAYQARFVRAPQFRFIQVGHGQREAPEMRLRHLHKNYLHDLSSDGEAAWLEKHRRYAESEAREQTRTVHAITWRQLLSRDALVRRRALKHLSHRLPLRPTMRFIYQYLLRGGFLDGAAGYRYCRLLSRYEQFVAEAIRRQTRSTADSQ